MWLSVIVQSFGHLNARLIYLLCAKYTPCQVPRDYTSQLVGSGRKRKEVSGARKHTGNEAAVHVAWCAHACFCCQLFGYIHRSQLGLQSEAVLCSPAWNLLRNWTTDDISLGPIACSTLEVWVWALETPYATIGLRSCSYGNQCSDSYIGVEQSTSIANTIAHINVPYFFLMTVWS